MAYWLRRCTCNPEVGPRFKSFLLPVEGFVFGSSPEFNSSTLCKKQPTAQPPGSWDFQFLFYSPCCIHGICLNTVSQFAQQCKFIYFILVFI